MQAILYSNFVSFHRLSSDCCIGIIYSEITNQIPCSEKSYYTSNSKNVFKIYVRFSQVWSHNRGIAKVTEIQKLHKRSYK